MTNVSFNQPCGFSVEITEYDPNNDTYEVEYSETFGMYENALVDYRFNIQRVLKREIKSLKNYSQVTVSLKLHQNNKFFVLDDYMC